MTNKHDYVEKIQTRLDKLDAKIQYLSAKANEAEADAKIEYEKQIDSLLEAQKDAQGKLDDLRGSGEDAWEDLKVGVESAWERFQTATNSAVSRITG